MITRDLFSFILNCYCTFYVMLLVIIIYLKQDDYIITLLISNPNLAKVYFLILLHYAITYVNGEVNYI